jgi:hypothetical protein
MLFSTMSRVIRALRPDDLDELSRFLTVGFQADEHAEFAAPDILRWKYLESGAFNNSLPLSYVALDQAGQIVGHVGLCRTDFVGRAIIAPGERASTMHIIDWLGSREARAVGVSLMRKAHEGVDTQFGLGVSQAALGVGERSGYELRSLVPVFTRVLRAGYWLRTAGDHLPGQLARMARNEFERIRHPPRKPKTLLDLHRVTAFGTEISPIIERTIGHAILTDRNPSRLNHMLRFPSQSLSGWHLFDKTGVLRGLAILNVIPTNHNRTKMGKIVDCLLDDTEVDAWHAAITSLTRELASQGADVVSAYASTPWTVSALERCGFRSRYHVKFHIRDQRSLIPRGVVFHLTPLEGDYAYT